MHQTRALAFILATTCSAAQADDACPVRVEAIVGPQQTRVMVSDEMGAEEAMLDPGESALGDAFVEALKTDGACVTMEIGGGATSRRIADAAAALLPGDDGTADVPAEGSLAPGTYDIAADDTAERLFDAMQVRQAEVLDRAWADRADDLPIATKGEALVLASLVSKEAMSDDERAQIAAVFVNRLRDGMALQSDPTVTYGASDGTGILPDGLTEEDYGTETPWNTYLIEGLPKTPIANPSEADIVAALNPADSDMLYFAADGEGGHRFAATAEEHEENVVAWQNAVHTSN